MQPRFVRYAVTFASLSALACDSPTMPGPPRTGASLGMVVFTPEGSATKHVLAVGDTGSVMADAGWDCGASHGYVNLRCPIDAVEIVVRVSDQRVVQLTVGGGLYGAHRIVAKAPGVVQISASTAGLVHTIQVEVVAASLPLDSVRVRPSFLSRDSALVEVDAAGNLIALTRAASISTRVVAFRGGDSTVFVPVTVESSNPAVGNMRIFCEFWWPRCDVPRNTVVDGSGPGTAVVTLTAGGQRYSFRVAVPSN